MLRLRLFFLVLLIASTSFAGEISGRVYRHVSKKPLAGVSLRMHVYKDDYEFSGVETKTDNNGRYRFRNLQTGAQYSYLFYPIYEGVNYPYVEADFSKNSSVENMDFEIADSTGSTENISVDESIFFEFGKKDVWKVTHEITIENKGDLLYHPDRADAKPLLFALFEGGFDLSYLEGVTRDNSKIDDQKDTLQVLLPMPPHQISRIKFSYYYLPEKRHVTFDHPAYLQRSNVSLFFKNNVRIVSEQFQPDPMMARGRNDIKTAFTSGPVKQENKIKFEIKGFFLQRDFLHMLVLGCCLLFIIFMLWISFTRKRVEKNRDKELTEQMLRYLMDMREQRKEGTIDERLYRKEELRIRNFLFQMSKSDKK